MTATAMTTFVNLADRQDRLFKNHTMEANLQVPIIVPDWVLRDFQGMLQSVEGVTLEMVMYRYHFGSLSEQEWEDQWWLITCYPHFSLMPHTDETEDDNINYARIAFMKDYGLQP
jgi:hypothetical protein